MKTLFVVLLCVCVSFACFSQNENTQEKSSVFKLEKFSGFLGAHYDFTNQDVLISFGGPGIALNTKIKNQPITLGLQILPSINVSKTFLKENPDENVIGGVLTGPYVQYKKVRLSISSQFGQPIKNISLGLAYKF